MASYLQNLFGALLGKPPTIRPFQDMGQPGTAIFGGFVQNKERSTKLWGERRWETSSDLLANISIIAASVRFFCNLTAKPAWQVEPAKDKPGQKDKSSDAAKQAAEFMQSVIESTSTNWARVVRRTAMYRFHGFTVQEWTAKRRADGRIGIEDIEPRPQWTIEQWGRDENWQINQVGQRSPQTGELLWLPRGKLIYLVDDTLTDSPEGMGLFRHLVEPAERIKRYLKLEGQGFERDLRGIPVGRAPYAALNDLVKRNAMTKAEAEAATKGLEDFVQAQAKTENMGVVLDSKTYEGSTGDGITVSSALQWGLDLLTSAATSLSDLNTAIVRESHDMARIMGTEMLMLGQGPSGSRALSADKSQNLYLTVNSAVGDMAEAFQRDIVGPVWQLNGLPDETRPKLKTEDAAYKDVEQVTAALRDMATAGAVLAPDDPVIDDVRDLLGVSRQPEYAALDTVLPPRSAADHETNL